MRTIIDVPRNTWANVKHFATVQKFSLNRAVQTLLEKALQQLGYNMEGKGEGKDGQVRN